MDGGMMVTVGVDTHTDVNVATVHLPAGRLLETQNFQATTRGYAQLATWAESFDKVGMEGTGSFGAGLPRRDAHCAADKSITLIGAPHITLSGRP